MRSDLALGASQGANIPHLDHGRREVGEEEVLVGAEAVDDGDGVGAGGGEELLVALEEAVVDLEVGVVVLVEGVGRGEVQIGGGVVASDLRADLSQLLEVRGVQSRVGLTRAAEVVKSVSE